MNVKRTPACWDPHSQGSLAAAASSPAHSGPPVTGRSSLTTLLGTGRPRPARRRRPPGRLGTLPWEKTSISCSLSLGPHASSATIIMNHTRNVRQLGERLRGPPALPPVPSQPENVQGAEGWGLNCRQQHQLIAQPMSGFLMCNVLANTLTTAHGAWTWEGGLLSSRLAGGPTVAWPRLPAADTPWCGRISLLSPPGAQIFSTWNILASIPRGIAPRLPFPL